VELVWVELESVDGKAAGIGIALSGIGIEIALSGVMIRIATAYRNHNIDISILC